MEIGEFFDADEDLGPAMRALNERQRRFVRLWIEYPTAKRHVLTKMAGYSNSDVGHRVQAHRLLHDEKVLAGVSEELSKQFRGKGAAISRAVLFKIATTEGHRDQLKAAVALADRGGFHVKTEHKVTVEHVDDGRLLELATRMAAELGVDRAKLIGGNVIEGEAHEVPNGSD